MSTLSEILRERGYVYQHSSETLEEIVDGPPRTFYLGVDPTADSFHIGHLQALLVMRRFIDAGHRAVLLIGGGTGMIGDPSGKSEERNLLDFDTVAKNGAALKQQAQRIFGGGEITLRNNADWLMPLKFLDFLRDIGKHFTVNSMIKREMVKDRLDSESAISYTEFAYSILQAYDFLHLHESDACDLQLGASDQWGNIMSGVELIRKKTGKLAYGLTSPLLVNKSTGKKFGKSEQGTIWLDGARTHYFDFYQFLFNTADDQVEELLFRLTLVGKNEIAAAMEMQRNKASSRHAQRLLARETTALVHGLASAERAERVSRVLFGDGHPAEMDDTDWQLLTSAPGAEANVGMSVVDALVACGLARSKREARTFIEDGAVLLNFDKVVDVEQALSAADFAHGGAFLKRGKQNIRVLKLG